MRRSQLIVLIIGFLLISFTKTNTASGVENCGIFNLDQTFDFGYNSSFPTWTTPGVNRVVTWVALDSGELNGKKIQRSLGTQNLEWLKEAIQSWDDALDSISFQEVGTESNADIRIGWTQVLQLDYETLFQVRTAQPVRTNASIELKSGSAFLIFKENFIHAVQSDIGHILGMGYINPSLEFESVMEWPFQAPYSQVPLGERDVALIRAIYSESTCPSTFSPAIQGKMNQIAEARTAKEKAIAEKSAAKEAEEKAIAQKLVEERNAALKKAAENAAAAAKAKIEASKKIICKKGSQSKTFIASKCPPGWTKAKR